MFVLAVLAPGAPAGWLIGARMRASGDRRVPVNVATGIVGALPGGFAPPQAGLRLAGMIGPLACAVVGAVLLVLIVNLAIRGRCDE